MTHQTGLAFAAAIAGLACAWPSFAQTSRAPAPAPSAACIVMQGVSDGPYTRVVYTNACHHCVDLAQALKDDVSGETRLAPNAAAIPFVRLENGDALLTSWHWRPKHWSGVVSKISACAN